MAEIDVALTYAEAEAADGGALVVVEGLDPFVPGEGPIEVEQLGSGHSNETFRVRRDGQSLILRRPPRPPYPARAHDVLREHAVLTALSDHGVPVPRTILACDDETVLGAPFYLMEHLDGFVIRETFPPELDVPEQRRSAVELFVDTLAAIHRVPWRETPLERIGRPSGYLERQLGLWTAQWDRYRTRPIPAIEQAAQWLASSMPATDETVLVHGDYKLDNAIFAPGRPARIAGIVDWEMATLGAPLADVGFLAATYLAPGERPDPVLGFSAATATAGCPTREEVIERYASSSGRDVSGLHWYEALALWKLAILLEGSYKRYCAGVSTDPFFALLEDGVPRLAERALLATAGRPLR
jgi:aminoglycoside phosphotransferase (APT) family kinase protein